MAFELNGWLKHIHYRGSIRPTGETLHAIVAHQVRTIAFENLDVLLERTIDIRDDAIYAKLVAGGRGGYCFELNGLLARGLRELGFEVRDLAARVLNAHAQDFAPRTHRMIQVTLNSTPWLVDVGFGGETLTAPMPLTAGATLGTSGGDYRIINVDEDFQLEREGLRGWHSLYRFDLQRQYLADYQLANHYVAHHPSSHFRHHLMLSLSTADGRISLLNRRLTHYCPARSHFQDLDDKALYQALCQRFSLNMSDPHYGVSQEAISAVMQRLTGAHAARHGR